MRNLSIKKAGLFFICLVLVLSMVTGCSPNSQAPDAAGNDSTKDSEKTYVLKIGHVQNEDNPLQKGLVQFKERVEERTNGKLQIQIFFSSQLGDTADVVEQARTGSNVGANTDAGVLSSVVPELGIVDAPYLFDSYEEINEFTSSDLFNSWADKATEHGYKILSFNWYEGPRHLLTKVPIESIEDVKNLKLRTTGSPVWQATVKAMGAKPTAMAWGEIYQGIQQKVIEGCEAQSVGIHGSRLYEVTDYLTKTSHFQLIGGIVIGVDWFNSLPEEYQDILIEEAIAGGKYASELAIEEIEVVEKEMAEEGLTISEIDLQQFKDATDVVYDQFEGYREIKKQIEEVLGK